MSKITTLSCKNKIYTKSSLEEFLTFNRDVTQDTFILSKPTIKALKKDMKYVQS